LRTVCHFTQTDMFQKHIQGESKLIAKRFNESASVDPFRAEETRIRSAYAKRESLGSLYSCFNPGNLFITQTRERRLLRLLKEHGCESLNNKKILEIGCGKGYWLREFVRFGAPPENIYGIDLISEDVAEAIHLSPPRMHIECRNAANLPFAAESFDIVLQFTVFTSILDPELKHGVAAEMIRVVKPDGLIVWYDFYANNPWNPDVRGVKKRNITQFFPGCTIKLQRLTLAPPLARCVAPYSWLACEILETMPWLCTHYLGAIKKRRPIAQHADITNESRDGEHVTHR